MKQSPPIHNDLGSSPLQSRSTPIGTERNASALLQGSLAMRHARLNAGDMLTTDEAADLVGTSRVTINAWIKKGRAVGLSQTTRGFKLPKWQFEPAIWAALPDLAAALSCTEGWAILLFLETPLGALGGLTPRAAIEQGQTDRVLTLAAADGA